MILIEFYKTYTYRTYAVTHEAYFFLLDDAYYVRSCVQLASSLRALRLMGAVFLAQCNSPQIETVMSISARYMGYH